MFLLPSYNALLDKWGEIYFVECWYTQKGDWCCSNFLKHIFRSSEIHFCPLYLILSFFFSVSLITIFWHNFFGCIFAPWKLNEILNMFSVSPYGSFIFLLSKPENRLGPTGSETRPGLVSKTVGWHTDNSRWHRR